MSDVIATLDCISVDVLLSRFSSKCRLCCARMRCAFTLNAEAVTRAVRLTQAVMVFVVRKYTSVRMA
jgi:hypothetical protein